MTGLARVVRLVRVEARRNALQPLLPLVLLVLALTPLARQLGPTALWSDRSTGVQSTAQMIGPFAAGAAAWTASREHRRGMTDLLASTPLAAWRRWLATWTASCGWAVLFYAGLAAACLALTATQATWGHPVIWPLLSGLSAVAAAASLGFAAGRLVPARVTVPLAALGTYLLMTLGMGSAVHGGQLGRLSPLYPSLGLTYSVYYAVRPDLSYLQIGCYLGLATAALAVPLLADRTADSAARRGGAVLAAAGLALITAAGGLALTSRQDAHGVTVPLLHDPASDRTVAYTPVCRHDGALAVCLHPAYASRNQMSILDTTVNRIAAPLAGTPGLPARAEQQPGLGNSTPMAEVRGNPPVLALPDFIVHGHRIVPAGFASVFQTRIALALLTPPGTRLTTPGPHGGARLVTPAQQAVARYLLRQAGDTPTSVLIPPDPRITTAADRLAALTTSARHAWFAAHVTALRAGTLALTELP